MQVVALAGRNAQTESWLRSVLAAVPLPDEGLLRYRHWTGEVEASVEEEAKRLAGLSPDLVVAKSFGTAVAARAFVAQGFRPRAAVLVGTPYAALDADAVQALRELAAGVETLYIQQAADPGGPASSLRGALGVARGEVAEVPGDDHLYQDIDALMRPMRPWLDASALKRGRA